MGVMSWIAGLFKPAADLVDNVHTSTEEKMQLKNALADIQRKANDKFIELELARLEAQKQIIVAESKSSHWLQANWRPMCSVAVVAIIILESFGLASPGEGIYTLATAFLGIYGAGRSIEKAASSIKLGK